MSRVFPSDDPFAPAADVSACRKPSSFLCLLLLPALGLAAMTFGTKAVPVGSLTRMPGDTLPDRCALRAERLREIETAHRNVVYWMRRVSGPGPAAAHDRAKLREWTRGEKHRRALFLRNYGYEAPP